MTKLVMGGTWVWNREEYESLLQSDYWKGYSYSLVTGDGSFVTQKGQ